MPEANNDDVYPFNASWEAFEEIDPYNPENTVRGFIRRSGRKTYGMLRIESVNGLPCPQEIYCTPKMGYPLSEKGFFKTTDTDQIEVYEKYDGTNIFGYTYKDAAENIFVSYKTRLKPFLGKSKFGDFFSLWEEMRSKYSTDDLIRSLGINLSFELYGKRNKILIDYSESLATRLLFGIDRDGQLISPMALEPPDFLETPVAHLIESFPGGDKFEEQYNRIREDLNKKLIVVEVEVDGEKKVESMSGLEGAVLYVIGPSDFCTQLKAKPDAVQDIHWANKGIPYHAIYTTILNAFELSDNPTPQMIDELLKEEFDEAAIARKRYTIAKMLFEVRFEKILKVEIFEKYKENNFDIKNDKRTCMRWFGERYDKKLAGKIYRYLETEFGD